jgi:hypothetical protein
MQNIMVITLSLLFISTAFSADQTVSPASHPKKAYLDPVQNKVFWPLEKPVWIRLAESADKNATSYLLTKDDDSSAGKTILPEIRLSCGFSPTETLRSAPLP